MIDVFSKFEVLKNGSPQTFTLDDLSDDVNKVALTFLILALIALVSNMIQMHSFNTVGAVVTYNLRVDLFSHFLQKTMMFFDKKEHSSGMLAIKLGEDCLTLNAIVSSSIGAIL